MTPTEVLDAVLPELYPNAGERWVSPPSPPPTECEWGAYAHYGYGCIYP